MKPFFDGAQVRVTTRDAEPWFILADVCKVLEIANARDAASRLDDDEKGVVSTDTPGGAQAVTIINESGLYSLIFTSRKEGAKRFKKWVTGTVLPSIRKTGGYGNAPDPRAALNIPAALRQLLADYAERTEHLETENAGLRDDSSALDRIAKAEGSLTLTEAAKTLQIQPRRLTAWLRMNGWIYQRGNRNVAYPAAHPAGILRAQGHDRRT